MAISGVGVLDAKLSCNEIAFADLRIVGTSE
jgi:hypothetical protein